MVAHARRSQRTLNIWPGFVDALTSLLLVITFLLVVFVLAQFYLGQTLSGRTEALQRLSRQVSELADLLSLERQANANLRVNVAELSSQLQSSLAAKDTAEQRLREAADKAQASEDDLTAKQEQLWLVEGQARQEGMKQFLDEKTFRPGLGPYKRKPGRK